MRFTETPLKGSYLVDGDRWGDNRGWFSRVFCRRAFEEIGHDKEWVQINQSFTEAAGTVRGMHYQRPPHEEIKLVRCIAGAVLDVIVDMRPGSSTYLQWTSAILSRENQRALYIPEGFAHGFQALEDNSELIYCHSEYYAPEAEGGLRFDDPALAIEWDREPINISGRDKGFPLVGRT